MSSRLSTPFCEIKKKLMNVKDLLKSHRNAYIWSYFCSFFITGAWASISIAWWVIKGISREKSLIFDILLIIVFIFSDLKVGQDILHLLPF